MDLIKALIFNLNESREISLYLQKMSEDIVKVLMLAEIYERKDSRYEQQTLKEISLREVQYGFVK